MAIDFSSGGSQSRPSITRTSYVSVSGSANIDFTNIPSDVNKINIWFHNLGYTGSGSILKFRLGDSGGIDTSDYNSAAVYVHSNNSINSQTDAIPIGWSSNENEHLSGCITLEHRPTSNVWIAAGTSVHQGRGFLSVTGGIHELTGTLDRIRFFTQGGTNFDGGEIWLTYEE